MPKPIQLKLSNEEKVELEQIRDHDPHPYMREHAAALLKIAAGVSGRHTALRGLLRKRWPDTVYRWVKRYQTDGLKGLKIRCGRGRKPAYLPKYANKEMAQEGLLHLLRQPLSAYGLSGTHWTLVDLLLATKNQLRLNSLPGMSQLLHRLHISLKRARNYLHSPDPYYVEKLHTIRFHVRCAQGVEEVVFLFEDELSFYRQPSLACAYELMGRIQPLARLGLKSNSVWRVAGLLNAWNGQVIYEEGSHISVPKLVKLYQKAVSAYPTTQTLFIGEDNWPVHAHPDVLAALQPQSFPHGLYRPSHWSTEPSPNAKRLDLPVQILFLPTYAPWTNPIEKLWKFVRQEVLHLHRFEDDWPNVKKAVTNCLDQFAHGSKDLLRYVGLSDPHRLYRSLVMLELPLPVTIFNS